MNYTALQNESPEPGTDDDAAFVERMHDAWADRSREQEMCFWADHAERLIVLARRGATITALRRQVEELQGERDAIAQRHEKALALGASNRERASAVEAQIADLERRLADMRQTHGT